NISLLGCDHVDIQRVTIRNGYSDGIDPDCCRHVRIAGCRVESRDDAIVLKSSLALGVRRSTEYVVVTDCDLVNVRNGLKIGTESAANSGTSCSGTARCRGVLATTGAGRKPGRDAVAPGPSSGAILRAPRGPG